MNLQQFKGNSSSGISEAQDYEEYTPTASYLHYNQYNGSINMASMSHNYSQNYLRHISKDQQKMEDQILHDAQQIIPQPINREDDQINEESLQEIENFAPQPPSFVFLQTPDGLMPVPVYTQDNFPPSLPMPVVSQQSPKTTYVSETLMKETISSQRKINDKVNVRNQIKIQLRQLNALQQQLNQQHQRKKERKKFVVVKDQQQNKVIVPVVEPKPSPKLRMSSRERTIKEQSLEPQSSRPSDRLYAPKTSERFEASRTSDRLRIPKTSERLEIPKPLDCQPKLVSPSISQKSGSVLKKSLEMQNGGQESSPRRSRAGPEFLFDTDTPLRQPPVIPPLNLKTPTSKLPPTTDRISKRTQLTQSHLKIKKSELKTTPKSAQKNTGVFQLSTYSLKSRAYQESLKSNRHTPIKKMKKSNRAQLAECEKKMLNEIYSVQDEEEPIHKKQSEIISIQSSGRVSHLIFDSIGEEKSSQMVNQKSTESLKQVTPKSNKSIKQMSYKSNKIVSEKSLKLLSEKSSKLKQKREKSVTQMSINELSARPASKPTSEIQASEVKQQAVSEKLIFESPEKPILQKQASAEIISLKQITERQYSELKQIREFSEKLEELSQSFRENSVFRQKSAESINQQSFRQKTPIKQRSESQNLDINLFDQNGPVSERSVIQFEIQSPGKEVQSKKSEEEQSPVKDIEPETKVSPVQSVRSKTKVSPVKSVKSYVEPEPIKKKILTPREQISFRSKNNIDLNMTEILDFPMDHEPVWEKVFLSRRGGDFQEKTQDSILEQPVIVRNASCFSVLLKKIFN